MVLMPKMMESLDPEQKEQMQKQMAMQQDPSKVCSVLCDWLWHMDLHDINMQRTTSRKTTHNLLLFIILDDDKIYIKMFTQMFADITGTGEEDAPPQIEKKPSSKAGGKTRRGKRD